jgi:hypothetical protein
MHVSCSSAVDYSSIVYCSATLRPCRSAAASCFEYPDMLGALFSSGSCVCSHCTCTSRVHQLSITAPSPTAARLFVRAALQRRRASSIPPCSAHSSLVGRACAVPAHDFTCSLAVDYSSIAYCSATILPCLSAAASCFEFPDMLGALFSSGSCVCSSCTCTSRVHRLSITAPSPTAARLFVCAALQQLRASSILICSAHFSLVGRACAVPAHALLVFISCRLQLHSLLQRDFSSVPLCSIFVRRVS